MIETMTFRLADGVDEADFVEADARFQQEFMYRQPGLLRRTTARGDDGEWIVVTLWATGEHADAAAAQTGADGLAALLEGPVTRRYTELPG